MNKKKFCSEREINALQTIKWIHAVKQKRSNFETLLYFFQKHSMYTSFDTIPHSKWYLEWWCHLIKSKTKHEFTLMTWSLFAILFTLKSCSSTSSNRFNLDLISFVCGANLRGLHLLYVLIFNVRHKCILYILDKY